MSVVREFRGGGSGGRPSGGGDSPAALAALGIGFFALIVGGAWAWNNLAPTGPGEPAARNAAAAPAKEQLIDPADFGRQPMVQAAQARLSAASVPTPAGQRTGARSRATFLASCLADAPIGGMMMALAADNKPARPNRPEEFEAIFTMMDQFGRMPGMVAFAGAASGRGGDNSDIHASSVEMVGDYIACALSRPPAVMCNADNRAAAMTYLDSYFKSWTKASAAFEASSGADRRNLDRQLNPNRHRRIEADLIKHARAGSLDAGDLGFFADRRLKELLQTRRDQPPACG